MDAFSRRVLGYNASSRLFTEQTTLSALEMAVNTRGNVDLEGAVLHSEDGGQYYDTLFLERTTKLKIINSMCQYTWDNGKAERINVVIKNNYLKHWDINNLIELKQSVDRAVNLYNNEKPHINLDRLTPIYFEKTLMVNTSSAISSTNNQN